MKSWLLAVALVAVVAMPALAGSPAGEKAWFDMQNCPMCKAITAETGLMENMTWDTYVTATGMMGVCSVTPKFSEAYKRANTKMMATMKEIEAGKGVEKLCGFCTSYGELVQAGAKSENFSTTSGDIMLLTATDPALIGKIQTHAQRTIDESKKMKEGMKAAAGK